MEVWPSAFKVLVVVTMCWEGFLLCWCSSFPYRINLNAVYNVQFLHVCNSCMMISTYSSGISLGTINDKRIKYKTKWREGGRAHRIVHRLPICILVTQLQVTYQFMTKMMVRLEYKFPIPLIFFLCSTYLQCIVYCLQACPSPSSISSHEKSKRKRDRQEMDGEIGNVIDAERPIKKIYIKPIEPPNR